MGSIPGLGRFPGGGHDNPLQYSWLEIPHGQRSVVGCSPWGHKEEDTNEQVSTHLKKNVITTNTLYKAHLRKCFPLALFSLKITLGEKTFLLANFLMVSFTSSFLRLLIGNLAWRSLLWKAQWLHWWKAMSFWSWGHSREEGWPHGRWWCSQTGGTGGEGFLDSAGWSILMIVTTMKT